MKMFRILRICALLALLAASGCVERELVITSEPEGAQVTINDVYSGTTPMRHSFVHYGTFGIRIVKEGYEPFYVEERVAAPLYERPGIDFVSEALVPARIEDRREFHYELVKIDDIDEKDAILARAEARRDAIREASEASRAEAAERESLKLPLPLREDVIDAEENADAAEPAADEPAPQSAE